MLEFSGSQHAYTCLPGLEYSLVRAVDASCPRNDTASVAALSDGRLMIVWHKYLADDETAILTYGFYGLNDYENNLPGQEWHDLEVMDLHAVRLTKAWIYARLAEVQGG